MFNLFRFEILNLFDTPACYSLVCSLTYILLTFKHQLVGLCIKMFESGFAEQKLREAEVKAFFEVLQEAVREKQQRSAQLVSDFEKHRKKVGYQSRCTLEDLL